MSDFDLIIKGGIVATAADTFRADVAVRNDIIRSVGEGLGTADETVDATGLMLSL
ncbi:hypothetical protein I5535_01500 [Rhodobacteraceae bacterium F11138]|nr:hypothetical protein [Rhodobacteraceae bacterium F11138]